MAFIIKTAKTIRHHWKKSTFAAIALTYGYDYAKEYFQIQQLMRIYCERAAQYGKQPIPVEAEPRTITVILNPNANKRKAAEEFEKYCAPILHLAGISVNVIKTDSEGHARTLIDDLTNTEAIVVAGGDGTFSEVITGLLRRTQENTEGLIPLGVLPLGKSNSVAQSLFPGGTSLAKVRSLVDATMAVAEEVVKPLDVLKIEVMDGENKPIYAASGIKWGAYRDADIKKDSYWYYGSLRKYATFLFNGYKSNLTWQCNANVTYTPPCKGCSTCTKTSPQSQKWYQRFAKVPQSNYSHVSNPECGTVHQTDVSTVDFNIGVNSSGDVSKLELQIGPKAVNYLSFVKDGWRSANGQTRLTEETIDARSIDIKPKLPAETSEAWFSIDNENYEIKPIKVTLLPRLINVFCKKDML